MAEIHYFVVLSTANKFKEEEEEGEGETSFILPGPLLVDFILSK